jgi:hypothetical protein
MAFVAKQIEILENLRRIARRQATQ